MKFIAFVALDDPYIAGSLAGISQAGPILRSLQNVKHGKILLIAPNERLRAASRLRMELHIPSELLPISTPNAPSLSAIVRLLDQNEAILSEYSDATILSTGTAQERAALWILKEKGVISGDVIEPPASDYSNTQTYFAKEPRAPFGAKAKTLAPAKPCDHPPSWSTIAAQVGCIGRSQAFETTLEEAARIANYPTPMLLTGETGAGKEVLARFIHACSPRAEMPMVAVNCAALPESLTESILFGHEKGSFTGAYKRQKGKFEIANEGTLFLDELGELSLTNQAKLLRVIEDKSVDLLGSSDPVKVDVRIIAATNKNLEEEVSQGRFREDLYYRLRAGEIDIPPLRERPGDISLIAQHLLHRFNSTLSNPKRLSEEALKFLESQQWPGNVRDLLNTLERAVLLCPRSTIEPIDFKVTHHVAYKKALQLPELGYGFSIEEYLQNIRSELIQKALQQAEGNQSQAARLLSVTPQAIYKHLKLKSLEITKTHEQKPLKQY